MKQQMMKCAGESKDVLEKLIKWLFLAVLAGLIIGGVGTLFAFSITKATAFRQENPYIVCFLPFAGLVIVGCYFLLRNENDKGTNMVLSAIHAGEEVPFKMAPLIFVSTVITHLFGGSAGREGAALQLGGSIGNQLGKLLHLDESDKHVMIMCGMSAAFSALFGTPAAAAIFAMEVVSVGVMYYSALVPCVFSSLVASHVAVHFGVHPEHFQITYIPELTLLNAVKMIILALACAMASALFCIAMHKAGAFFRTYIKNPYLRIFAGGAAVVLLAWLLGTGDYLGAGMQVVDRAMKGEVVWYAFLAKIVFTSLTLGTGYKGGEIVPSFFVGATLGCLVGKLIGLSPSLCAASGMVALFCGVTNCPVTSLLIAFELFGFEGLSYFLIAVSISYLMSGYYGLYEEQSIVYSKYKAKYINRKTR